MAVRDNCMASTLDGKTITNVVFGDGTALASLGIRKGTVALVGGTATVTDAATTADTRVLLTPLVLVPGAGGLTVTYSHVSNSAGASFVVRANIAAGTINVLDTSTLDYLAIG